MELYRTILKEAEEEQTILKSRFIARVKPVTSKEEADEFINRIKKENRDATHNVPAFVIGDKMQLQWASDDGEPQGTSGAPMVKLMTQMNLTNMVIVVTRYFGGIKLGTGGLVRAYTSSAKLGIEKAGIGVVHEMTAIDYEMDYASYSKLESIKSDNFSLESADFGENVTVCVSCEPDESEGLESTLVNLTGGKGKILKISKKILTKPIM